MLGTLSLDERVTALVVSIITRDPEAVGAIVRLFACGIGDGRPIVLENRIALAELMRDCADYCEPEIITG